jgi:hypothetical protein
MRLIGPWTVIESRNGISISSADFTHDVVLRMSGDFAGDEQALEYARQIAARLNECQAGGMPAHPTAAQIDCLMGLDVTDEEEARQVWQVLVLAGQRY